jgi:hypothetical protein
VHSLPQLKPEYAAALHAIDVEGVPVKAFAERRGLSAGKRRRPGVPRPWLIRARALSPTYGGRVTVA